MKMFFLDSFAAKLGLAVGACPVGVDGRPSGAGRAVGGLLAVGSIAAAAYSPWAMKNSLRGRPLFDAGGGVLWAMLVAAASSLLAISSGLLWAFKNTEKTSQLFQKASSLLRRLPPKEPKRRLHTLVAFDALRALGEALRLYAILSLNLPALEIVFWLLYFLLHLVPLAIDLQTWALCRLVQRGFEHVNEELDGIIATESPGQKNALFCKTGHLEGRLSVLRRLHGDLRALAADLNGRYGLDMLVAIVHGRLLVVLYLYVIVATVLRGQLQPPAFIEIQLGLASLASFGRIFALCGRFEAAASQAADTLSRLQRLSVERFPQSVNEEINIFSLQVQSCLVSFTALGFFSLDIALISSIVGTVMTYLVILIQFESSDTEQKPK